MFGHVCALFHHCPDSLKGLRHLQGQVRGQSRGLWMSPVVRDSHAFILYLPLL